MPKRSSTIKRYAQLTRAARSERTKQIKRLKSLGLVSKRKNLKSAVVRRGLLSKYKDVLQHKAAVVKVPSGFKVKSFAKSFRVSGLNIVIPKVKGERVRLEKSTGRIVSTRKVGGERVKRILHVGGKMPTPRKGKKFMYAVPFSGGQRVRFESLQMLQEFMAGYNTYKNWEDYLDIEEIDKDKDDESEAE